MGIGRSGFLKIVIAQKTAIGVRLRETAGNPENYTRGQPHFFVQVLTCHFNSKSGSYTV